MVSDYENLIALIDERIHLYFSQKGISEKMIATVVSVATDNKSVTVRYAIDNKTSTFLNKSQETVKAGDCVHVELINGNLTNGVVIMKCGK